MYRRILAAVAAVVIGLTTQISFAKSETQTLTDTLGRSVTVPLVADRILLGFYFEDFYAIGGPDAYEKVVAISKSAWRDWRNSQWKSYVAVNPSITQIKDVGEVDAGTFSIESAIASKPDVAIIAAWQYRALGETVAKLEGAGIPVVVVDYNAQIVEKHVLSTQLIGKILGVKEHAQKLADEYAAAVADVRSRVKSAGGDMKRVYIELGNKGAKEYGNTYTDIMWGQAIAIAGGKNIALGQVGHWAPLSPEYVISSNPEVIFLAGSYWSKRKNALIMGFGVKSEETQARLAPYISRPGWKNLEAVKSGRVYSVYHGGARTLYDYAFLQYIAKALYPEAFADIDPIATHRKFYEKYLPVKAEGVFMYKLQ